VPSTLRAVKSRRAWSTRKSIRSRTDVPTRNDDPTRTSPALITVDVRLDNPATGRVLHLDPLEGSGGNDQSTISPSPSCR
jgi:hypothetical protein